MFKGLIAEAGPEKAPIQTTAFESGSDGNVKNDVVSIRVNAPSIPIETRSTAIYDRARVIYFRARANRGVRPASII